MKQDHWVIIDFKNKACPVTIDPLDGNKFHWWGGVSYATFDISGIEILEDLGMINADYDILVETVYKPFYRKYNLPVAEMRISDGWLGTDGKFYPCRYSEHDSLAEHLSVLYYDSMDGVRELEKQGWIRVHGDGLLANMFDWETEKRRILTNEQLDTIVAFINNYPGTEFAEEIKDNLKTYLYFQENS